MSTYTFGDLMDKLDKPDILSGEIKKLLRR